MSANYFGKSYDILIKQRIISLYSNEAWIIPNDSVSDNPYLITDYYNNKVIDRIIKIAIVASY